ncbi:hypothetical protein [Ornithinimicrobium murale]|uniref:hypothetical protein n=1 Tax=Ornithinimicrobium murale TaxID=1050153 RepID=UPI0013B45EAA|nr:hypothetical protein [Ornithinimicrobium murale]
MQERDDRSARFSLAVVSDLVGIGEGDGHPVIERHATCWTSVIAGYGRGYA